MTKSERIFKNNYYECLNHINAWGSERNPNGSLITFNRLDCKDNESITTRTLNDIELQLARKINEVKMIAKYSPSENDANRLLACEAIETIIAKHRKILANI